MENRPQNSCCCGPGCPPPDKSLKKPYVSGVIPTVAGLIPMAVTRLSAVDKLGEFKVRLGFGRMTYTVEPGLYAAGAPDDKSPVFVTANFKLSFDRLRASLDGIDSWILVLDTKGINVWCAAGKGTFGTAELVNRIAQTGLAFIVSHRKLIVPQLGATGVSAHEVKNMSGFNVHYGPIRAEDIPAFVRAGFRATPQMRLVTFPLGHRLALVPTELKQSFKYLLISAVFFFIISGIGKSIFSFDKALTYGLPAAAVLAAVYILGNVLPPALLPWLPGKPFSVKGLWVAIMILVALGFWYAAHHSLAPNLANAVSWLFIIPAIVSFLALNFTGSTTFTSLSGVRKEMKVALPIQIGFAATGVILWTVSMLV